MDDFLKTSINDNYKEIEDFSIRRELFEEQNNILDIYKKRFGQYDI